MESSPAASSEKLDSVYNFAEKISSGVQLFVIDSARHEDFGCLPTFVRASRNCNSDSRFNTITKLTLSFLADHLKGKKTFTETINGEIAGKRLYEKAISKAVNERSVNPKENTTNTRIEDKIIDTIFSLKEVKDRARYIEEQSKGKNHLKIWTAAIPDLPSQPYFWIKVGEDNGINLVTHFNFYVYPEDMKVMYYDVVSDSAFSLSKWRQSLVTLSDSEKKVNKTH